MVCMHTSCVLHLNCTLSAVRTESREQGSKRVAVAGVAAANAHMWELLEAEAAEKERVARDDARRAKRR